MTMHESDTQVWDDVWMIMDLRCWRFWTFFKNPCNEDPWQLDVFLLRAKKSVERVQWRAFTYSHLLGVMATGSVLFFMMPFLCWYAFDLMFEWDTKLPFLFLFQKILRIKCRKPYLLRLNSVYSMIAESNQRKC